MASKHRRALVSLVTIKDLLRRRSRINPRRQLLQQVTKLG
jgi:hypothetical protein